jgi:hypothetical protein
LVIFPFKCCSDPSFFGLFRGHRSHSRNRKVCDNEVIARTVVQSRFQVVWLRSV